MNEFDEINTDSKKNKNNSEILYNESNSLLDISNYSNKSIENSMILESKMGYDLYEPLELSSEEEEEIKEEIIIYKTNDYKKIMENLTKDINKFKKNIETYNDYPFFFIQNTIKFIPKLSKESENSVI